MDDLPTWTAWFLGFGGLVFSPGVAIAAIVYSVRSARRTNEVAKANNELAIAASNEVARQQRVAAEQALRDKRALARRQEATDRAIAESREAAERAARVAALMIEALDLARTGGDEATAQARDIIRSCNKAGPLPPELRELVSASLKRIAYARSDEYHGPEED